MKKLVSAAAIMVLAVAALYVPVTAQAVPAFARQTNQACVACHFQHIPMLNAFGRNFKANGYTMGGPSLIGDQEKDHLSIPANLNASILTKTRIQKRNGDKKTSTGDDQDLNQGQFQFPDEAAFLVGGRGGEHVGFLLEASLKDGDSRFTSFKIPFVYKVGDVAVNLIPFTTDSQGAAYSLELLNTGALRLQRGFEHRTQVYSQQYIGTDGAATGFALAAVHQSFFVNVTQYNRQRTTAQVGPYITYARLAATPTIGDFDLGAGIQVWRGVGKNEGNGGTTKDTEYERANAYALDVQLQGKLGNMPLGVYVAYANAAKSKADDEKMAANIMNSSTNKPKSAWNIAFEFGVVPDKLFIGLAYRAGKDGDSNNDGKSSENATTVVATYEIAQNVELQFDHTWYTGNAKPGPTKGANFSTLLLEAAF